MTSVLNWPSEGSAQTGGGSVIGGDDEANLNHWTDLENQQVRSRDNSPGPAAFVPHGTNPNGPFPTAMTLLMTLFRSE